jgi:hypothetical protein
MENFVFLLDFCVNFLILINIKEHGVMKGRFKLLAIIGALVMPVHTVFAADTTNFNCSKSEADECKLTSEIFKDLTNFNRFRGLDHLFTISIDGVELERMSLQEYLNGGDVIFKATIR